MSKVVVQTAVSGGWDYYATVGHIMLSDEQVDALTALFGASVEYDENNNTWWVKTRDRAGDVVGYLKRLPYRDQDIMELVDRLEDALGSHDWIAGQECVKELRRRLNAEAEG